MRRKPSNWAILSLPHISPYRHFERSEKSSLHTGETESVR